MARSRDHLRSPSRFSRFSFTVENSLTSKETGCLSDSMDMCDELDGFSTDYQRNQLAGNWPALEMFFFRISRYNCILTYITYNLPIALPLPLGIPFYSVLVSNSDSIITSIKDLHEYT